MSEQMSSSWSNDDWSNVDWMNEDWQDGQWSDWNEQEPEQMIKVMENQDWNGLQEIGTLGGLSMVEEDEKEDEEER